MLNEEDKTTPPVQNTLPYKTVLDREIPSNKYTLIEFPGLVQNVEKAIEMLGGLESIEKVFKKKMIILSRTVHFW